MKVTPVLLTLIILFASYLSGLGQEKPDATLTATFGRINLGELLARVDSFMQEIERSPNTQGYVVIHPGKDSAERNFRLERRYEGFIESNISLQKFDKSRISIVRGEEKESIEVALWKVPAGVEKPFKIEEKWAEAPLDLSKPFVFGFTYIDEIFPNFIPEFYADHLRNNDFLRGHIVVFDSSRKATRERANQWIKVLTEEYNVPRKRLKVFFGKSKNSVIDQGEGNNPVEVEFWLVPERKRK